MSPKIRDVLVYGSIAAFVFGMAIFQSARAADVVITGCDTPQVIVCKAGGATVPPPVVVTPPPPPPKPTVLSCPGFTNTKVIDAVVPPAQGGEVRYFTSSSAVFSSGGTSRSAGFGPDDAVVVRFTMPAGEPLVTVSMTYTGTATLRTAVLSDKPCDFTVPSAAGLFARDTKLSSFSFGLTSVPPAVAARGNSGPILVTPGVYYLNVSNRVAGVNRCGTAACDAFFTFYNTP